MRNTTKKELEKVEGNEYVGFELPKEKWEWDVFGGSLIVVRLLQDAPWWRRILAKIFLGSVWKKL